jgi:hypothetical protein
MVDGGWAMREEGARIQEPEARRGKHESAYAESLRRTSRHEGDTKDTKRRKHE